MPATRKRPRIPKKDRKNLRLWAEGARESILLPHLARYGEERDLGWNQERAYLKKVCNEFHARVDWRIADHEEPTLAEYDPEALRVEETLSDDEEVAKRARLKILNGRIRRWFTYRIRRRRRRISGLDPLKDPFAILLSKLAGVTKPSKARQGYQQYMHESYKTAIAPTVQKDWAELRAKNDPQTLGKKEPKAGFRAKIALKLFKALPEDEQAALSERAKESAAKSKADYEAALKNPPSNKPQDRQKCIDALPEFLAPILRGIQEYTGLHSVIVMGGPIPKYGGELKTVHVAWGRNKTAAAVHFPQWDKERFSQHVLKFMVEYLGTAFTPEESTAAALPSDLDGAKYTIDDDPGLGDLSSDDSDSDSDEPDDESESESESHSKKRKIGDKTTSGTSKRDAPSSDAPLADSAGDKSTTTSTGAKRKRAPRKGAAPPAAPSTMSASTSSHSVPPAASSTMSASTSSHSAPPAASSTTSASTSTSSSSAPAGPILASTTVVAAPVSLDDLPYHALTFDQQVARNKKRAQAVLAMWKNDLREFMPAPAPPPPPPRPRPRPVARKVPETVGPSRRSQRLAGAGAAVEEGNKEREEEQHNGDEMDLDDGAGAVPMDLDSTEGLRPASALSAYTESRASSPPATDAESTMDIDDTFVVDTRARPDFYESGEDGNDEYEHRPLESPSRTDVLGGQDLWAAEGTHLASTQQTPANASDNALPRDPPQTPPSDTPPPDPTKTSPDSALPPEPPHSLDNASPPEPPGTSLDSAPPPEPPHPLDNATPPEPPRTPLDNAPPPVLPHPLDSASPPEPPACPAGAPEWFSHAHGEMTKKNLGAHFNAVLAAWTRIEAACAFDNAKHALPSKGRPEHVGRWIQAARGRRNQPNPVVLDTKKYETEWWGWWNGLQPAWRTKESDGITWTVGGAYGKDWEMLSYWGQNGMLSVVASLYFWGCAVEGAPVDELDGWDCAVNDVSWVFEGLALFYEMFKKRR